MADRPWQPLTQQKNLIMADLFKAPSYIYRWKDIKSFLVRSQYNELLKLVTNEYFTHQYPTDPPRFLDSKRCLTLVRGDARCNCDTPIASSATSSTLSKKEEERKEEEKKVRISKIAVEEAKSKRRIAAYNLNSKWEKEIISNKTLKLEIEENGVLKVLIDAIKAKKDTTEQYDAVVKILESDPLGENLALLKTSIEAYEKGGKGDALWANIKSAQTEFDAQMTKIATTEKQNAEIKKLSDAIIANADIKKIYEQVVETVATLRKTILAPISTQIQEFKNSVLDAVKAQTNFQNDTFEFYTDPREAQYKVDTAIEKFNIAKIKYQIDDSIEHEIALRTEEVNLKEAEKALFMTLGQYQLQTVDDCRDAETDYFCLPHFLYNRKQEITPTLDFLKFKTHGLTVGAVYWLYNYERMGVFKILGVLLDDYNYKGQYTISGNRIDNKDLANRYSALIDLISTLHRLGISSNLRDRVSTYQRVLGMTIDNNLSIESERNIGLMPTFATLNTYMLQYYADKRLATAIQTGGISRSSVATQTSIKDTLTLFQQQLEPFQYGRNQINTFLGIATVHATLCLLYMLRKEIGIPDQYEAADEFVQSAYEILVLKRTAMINEKNRFVLYDNCASYGYQLFTDFEMLNVAELNISSDPNSTFNKFLDDSESKVEGLKNALVSLPDGAGLSYNNQ
jgi:hypothetical protein